MNKYLQENQALWNELAEIHQSGQGTYYDLEGFKSGKLSLKSIELEELGDVTGKSLLHLQCHFGMDTLSWARLGAKVTGVDYSEKAIQFAQLLSEEVGIEARFLCSDIYDLRENLQGKFDIVYTSYGVLCWLPDLARWAQVIEHFLKPGGIFYIVDGHPFSMVLENLGEEPELRVAKSYFPAPDPAHYEPDGDYDDPSATVQNPSYEWSHSLGEIISTLAQAGLHIEFLHEFPYCDADYQPFMAQDAKGWWHLRQDLIPMTFSLKASKR